MDYDLKITGGTIVDGTGAAGYRGDVGIAGGKVVALGKADGDARQVVEADGRVVCPGFVDIHTHYDAQIMWDRMLSISPWHGVTSVVMGNCGFGVAPTREDHRDMIVRTLEKVEGMSVEALRAGMGRDWGFETFPDYLDRIEAGGTAINVGALQGHTPLRLFVMGPEATERQANEDEMARMRALMADALNAGALGLATSKLAAHVGFEGRPVASRLASMEEIMTLAGAVRSHGRGMIQSTLGPGLLLDEMEEVAAAAGSAVCWTALLAGSAFGKSRFRDQLEKTREQQARGVQLYPQVTPRPLNFEFQFKAPAILEQMSFFKPVAAADFDGKCRIYRDPDFRAAFRERWDTAWPSLAQAFGMMVISECATEAALEERRVADIAAERGVHPVDLALDLALASGLETRFRMPIANHDEDEVADLLVQPGVVLGLSDAGAHASQLCDACQATDLLGRWVREKQVLSLERAVQMLTADPAKVFGLSDRGRLAEGWAADIVIFDPKTVAAGPLRRVRDFPGGADRLISEAAGIDTVIVNGTVLRRDNRDVVGADGPLPGRLLRHGRAA
ncbi:amidohydrolase family protein [Marinibaculum pumilum]|uniref:Amidohydrolase family protein n=1 Tax=Marinibaculum pumilum TaxID=1766165 RepID=A0ABV7KZL0_9PROT